MAWKSWGLDFAFSTAEAALVGLGGKQVHSRL